jgi:hypothetical protein
VAVAVDVGGRVLVGVSVGVEVGVGDLVSVAVGDADGVGPGVTRELANGKRSVPPAFCQPITTRLKLSNPSHTTAMMLSGLLRCIHSSI